MSSKELKDLIIVNLTGIITVATSIKTIFPQSTTDPEVNNLIQAITLFYWIFVAGLLVSYITIHQDEKKNRTLPIEHKIEKWDSNKIENIYSSILVSNLLFTVVSILTLVIFSNYQSMLSKNLIQPFLFWFFKLFPLIAELEACFAIAFPLLAPHYFYIKDRIGVNPVNLYSVKEFVNVKMTTAIVYASRFTYRSLQKRQQK